MWCLDEAGPYPTVPYSGSSWQPSGKPVRYSQKYQPNGTAKVLTLFHPQSGQVHLKGVMRCPNYVLHSWIMQTLTDILSTLPAPPSFYSPSANYLLWHSWCEGAEYLTLPTTLPPLRMLLVMDNLAGHKSIPLVHWLWAHGILPLYTPLSGSWLNMGESIQRLLKRRTLDGQTPTTPEEIIAWFDATALAWNSDPTPFIWNGRRKLRRKPATCHLLGGSGAASFRSLVHVSHTDNGDAYVN